MTPAAEPTTMVAMLPPPVATTKDYPVCTRKQQDSCRNPGKR
jgi:hypothetical protein